METPQDKTTPSVLITPVSNTGFQYKNRQSDGPGEEEWHNLSYDDHAACCFGFHKAPNDFLALRETPTPPGDGPRWGYSADFVLSNLGGRVVVSFYELASGIVGHQWKVHPNQAQRVKILRPDLIGVWITPAP